MENKKRVPLSLKKAILTLVLFLCASFFMHNFYKITIGFIANEYSDPNLIIPMMVSYVLPVLCFVAFFINYYLKKFNKIATSIYSVFVIGVATFALVGVFAKLGVYVSNNSLGVYQSLPSIIIQFPYDAIVVSILLILVQLFNLSLVIKPNHKFSYLKEQLYTFDYFKVRIFDFPFVLVIALYSFFTIGDFICGLNSIGNALYDLKYLFLLLWVLVPSINLIMIMFRFENRFESKKNKTIYLASSILVNALFIVLFFVFEVLYPNFVASVGKPLFPITYSISLPVEIMIIIGVQALSMVIAVKKIVYLFLKKEKSE